MRSERMNEFTMSGPAWFDEQPEPVLLVEEGRVRYCNPAARALGVCPGEPLPQALERVLDGDGEERWQESCWSCHSQSTQEGVLYQLRRVEPSGVTLERLGDLAQSLRKPLSDVFGALQLLRRDSLAPKDAEKYLAIGSKGCHVLLRLVENMEGVADGPERDYQFQLLDLGGLCAQVVRECQTLVELAGRSIRLDAQAGNLLVRGDSYWLRRLLYQLISNGLHAVDQGGSLVVGLQLRKSGGKYVVLTLSDSGEGFAPEDLEAAFDPGQSSVKPLAPDAGAGLGLALCRDIVTAHGGNIMVGTGKGGVALIRLPLGELEEGTHLHTSVDYSGGVNEAMVQLSDALPWQCYMEKDL